LKEVFAMSIGNKVKRVISLLLAIITLGTFTSFAYAENCQLSSTENTLHQEALLKIEPKVMEDMEKEEVVEVLVYMKDQLDSEKVASDISNRLSSQMTPYNAKLAVRRGVVEALKDKSNVTQDNILKYLKQWEKEGKVIEYKSYYIVNMIYVKATTDVIEKICYFDEVERIYKNETHMLELPIKEENKEENTEIEKTSTGVEWNIARINADQVWDFGFDGTGVVVGTIDSGVDWAHPALKDKWRGYDPETGEIDPVGNWYDPWTGSQVPVDGPSHHGTHVMGTILGQEPDGSNKIGVAPGAKWIAVRAFNNIGMTTNATLIDAGQWMLAPDGDPSLAPDVVNNSWSWTSGIDDWYRDIIRNYRAARIFPVYSAGNDDSGNPQPGSISNPANYPEAFAVAATDMNDQRADFSRLGPSEYDEKMIKPNISAPGVNIRSSVPGGYEDGWNGTSMAAPHITGTVALLLSADNSLTVDEIENIIISTAKPLTDDMYPASPNFGYGYGLVDAFDAVASIVPGTGHISGKVYVPGEDKTDPVIIHEQEIFDITQGSDIEIYAEVLDDVSVAEVELYVKQKDKTYWSVIPMRLVSGDYKDGLYKATIPSDLVNGDGIQYKIGAKDFEKEVYYSEDYFVNIIFGILPDDYEQGFESIPYGWIFTGDFEYGQPSGDDPAAFEGEQLAGTVLGGKYNNSGDSWLISPPIDLRNSSLKEATLRFYQWYETEYGYDFCNIFVSTDYKESWQELDYEFSGIGTEWKEAAVDLSDYIGSDDPVYVAFRFTSDRSKNFRGWYIDNIRLVATDMESPAAPENIAIKPVIPGLKLTWNPSIDADVDVYRIYRSDTSGEGYAYIGETSDNSFMDTDVEANSTYYYVIRSVDFSGNISEYSEEVSITVPVTEVLFYEDFEQDNGGFTTAGTNNPWAWGIPQSGPGNAASGYRLWATNLAGEYFNSASAYIESPSIVVPEDKVPVLSFNHWYTFEGITSYYDYGEVYISNDNGATWTNVTPNQKYGSPLGKWLYEEIPLIDYRGDTIKIRFKITSDSSTAYDGWYIDDVRVVGFDYDMYPMAVLEDSTTLGKDIKPKEDQIESIEYECNPIDTTPNDYKIVDELEMENTSDETGLIPAAEAVVTILETGRSMKVDPATGQFYTRIPAGVYNLRAEAYGYYPKDLQVEVGENETIKTRFILDPKPQGTIVGRVYDRYYGNPAANAIVKLVEDTRIAPVRTDSEGYFEIPNVYIGTYTIKVDAEGFNPGEATVTVSADETVEINIGLKRFVGNENQLIYDDGTCEDALVVDNIGEGYYGLAVRFTPEKLIKVKGANVYFWGDDFPEPGGTRIGFLIYGTDENGVPYQVGEPIYTDVVRGDWNYIDLSSLYFSTERDFYISTVQAADGPYSPAVGIDKASPLGYRSYVNYDGHISTLEENDVDGAVMIRAIIDNSISTPVITNLQEVNYVNRDSITVEGIVDEYCTVNLYVNGEKVGSQVVEDEVFAIETELPNDENEIMVKAEMNGIETEPSDVVIVRKDKVSPVLVVDEPADNSRINKDVIDVTGNASDDIHLQRVLINDVEVETDENGNFSKKIILDNGENVITVKAVDIAGNETVVQRVVAVNVDTPVISNIEPSNDVELRAGDTFEISFTAPEGGQGYFKIMFPLDNGLSSHEIGIPMTEVDGHYSGIWEVPEDLAAVGLQVMVIYIDEFGNRVSEIAEGRVTVIGNMEHLNSNTVIVGDKAYDISYLNKDSKAQLELIEWFNSGNTVYIKLDENTIVDLNGHVVTIGELPVFLTYYDSAGNMTYYEK